MASTEQPKPKRKPRPQPLTRSLDLIQEERKNVARLTRERCALLSIHSEKDQDYSVEKATQTEIPLHEVLVEIHNWHTCLNAFCFCLILLSLHGHQINKSIIFICLSVTINL